MSQYLVYFQDEMTHLPFRLLRQLASVVIRTESSEYSALSVRARILALSSAARLLPHNFVGSGCGLARLHAAAKHELSFARHTCLFQAHWSISALCIVGVISREHSPRKSARLPDSHQFS